MTPSSKSSGLYIAGSEPPSLRAIADVVSNMAEAYGADIYFVANGRKVGVQRKEIKDFVASASDGRLAKELMQMEALDVKGLIVEGKVTWTNDGMLSIGNFGNKWTRAQFSGALWSIMQKGVWVWQTASLAETIQSVSLFRKWCSKDRHSSLMTRPALGKGMWGSGSTAEFQDREHGVWLLMGFPGIGRVQAERIWDSFEGGIFGLKEGVTMESLMGVKGVGKKTAETIVRILG